MSSLNILNRQLENEFVPLPSSKAKRSQASLPVIHLRRSGMAPIKFAGQNLLMATSYCTGPSLWHEVNVYKGSAEAFAVDIRTFFKREGERDVFFAAECGSLEEAIMIIEGHDATSAIAMNSRMASIETPLHEVVMDAVYLRLRIEEARRQYSDLVGEVLYDLTRLSG
jgi:hypothetical protein